MGFKILPFFKPIKRVKITVSNIYDSSISEYYRHVQMDCDLDKVSVNEAIRVVGNYRYKTKKKMKTKLSKETAKSMYDSGIESVKRFALENYPELGKKELPKSWERLNKVCGFYDNGHTGIEYIRDRAMEYNKNVFYTIEQAQASIALAQLSQLREVYRDGWEPDWDDTIQEKRCITIVKNKIKKENWYVHNKFLSFQDEETRDLFLENFRDLIEQAKPLLG